MTWKDALETPVDSATENGDQTVLAVRLEGMTYVCAVPNDLGRITTLENKNGTMIAHTEAGVSFIVPLRTKEAACLGSR